MKIFCLLLILTNVSFFLWEFRAGAFDKVEDGSPQLTSLGVDTILLANEVEKESALLEPNPDNAEQTEMLKPEETAAPSEPGNDPKPFSKSDGKQTDPSKIQSP